MYLYKCTSGIYVKQGSSYYPIDSSDSWDVLVNRDDLYSYLNHLIKPLVGQSSLTGKVLAPIGSQEVWATGGTYFSSRLARMEESRDAGGGDFYSRVYQAVRPEIFFKATPARVVGHGQPFRIRKDSEWDVPEPELTLFATSSGKIVGYTIGNDVSSRSIEGENPLYLPQAKTFDQCACLGPGLYVPKEPLSMESTVAIQIERAGKLVFRGETSLSEMKRTPGELIEFLFRETSFEHGVFLMTGTGIVPGSDFTLQSEDIVSITIDLIGTSVNSVR